MNVSKDFVSPKRIRRMAKNNNFRFRGGKLYPAMFHAVREHEGGVLNQTIGIELDPIPGRLLSEITAHVVTMFVPAQAMDALRDPNAAYAGMTEVVREKLLAATPLFDLENEGAISMTAKVNPKSVGGQKKVNIAVRWAYICAINTLRQRAYFNATLLPHTHTAIAPALYAETVLDKINGVLDPDDRINGAVDLQLPMMNLPVKGIGFKGDPVDVTGTFREAGGSTFSGAVRSSETNPDTNVVGIKQTGSGPTATPDIHALFAGAGATMSLDEFYNAEKMDAFARIMDQMRRDNPQYGDEMVLRWAHGLSIDPGRLPFIMAERMVPIRKSLQSATDTAGVEDDVLRTDGAVVIPVTVPIPRTELGGMIVTLVAIKPEEKLASQPEPFLSEPWTANNYVADSLALDPVPVTVRELYSDCAVGDESNVVAYTGLNALKELYVDYGFSRSTSLASVDNKTAIWQLEVPLSVSPTNVNYPDYIDHGVFAFGGTEASPQDVATLSITSTQTSPTPMIVGPTPVEDIGVNNSNIFEEE